MWNHRIVKHKGQLVVAEAFYNKAGYWAWSEPALSGSNMKELRWALEGYIKAFEKPVLTKKDFGAGAAYQKEQSKKPGRYLSKKKSDRWINDALKAKSPKS